MMAGVSRCMLSIRNCSVPAKTCWLWKCIRRVRRSADLRVDVTLSARLPQWPPLKELSAGTRSGFCNVLRQLGPLATARVDELKELATDASPVLRVDSMMALHAVSPQWNGSDEMPAAKDDQESAYREQVSNSTNNHFWPIVMSADRSKVELDRAVRLLEAAFQLTPKNGPLCNSLAVAQYRVGAYEKAYASVQRSISLQDASPIDYAILAMTARQLGKADEATTALAKLKELMQREASSGNAEAQAFAQEAEKLFADNAVPTVPQ